MRIIHCVESYSPSVGGMQEVVKQLSERLVKLGHDVTVATRYHEDRRFSVLNGVKIEAFAIEGNPKEAVTAEEKRYVDFLLQSTSDVITFFAAQQWATDLALPVLDKLRAKKVSVPTGYSGLYKEEYATYFEKMKHYIHAYDMNVYLSNDYRDINFARENNVQKLTIIPNGAAADEFLPESNIHVRNLLKLPGDAFLVLLVGSYTGIKGHREALEMFLKSDLKNATLLMIGNKYEYFKRQYIKHPYLAWLYLKNVFFGNKRVIFNFYSREVTVAAYKQADLFLFPSNIECSPIVLFECAASALPFLASEAGNSKEISEWTGGGEIIPCNKDKDGYCHVRIREGVQQLNALYHDAAKRKSMGQTAFLKWQAAYSWEKITMQYESLYKQLLQNA